MLESLKNNDTLSIRAIDKEGKSENDNQTNMMTIKQMKINRIERQKVLGKKMHPWA